MSPAPAAAGSEMSVMRVFLDKAGAESKAARQAARSAIGLVSVSLRCYIPRAGA